MFTFEVVADARCVISGIKKPSEQQYNQLNGVVVPEDDVDDDIVTELECDGALQKVIVKVEISIRSATDAAASSQEPSPKRVRTQQTKYIRIHQDYLTEMRDGKAIPRTSVLQLFQPENDAAGLVFVEGAESMKNFFL